MKTIPIQSKIGIFSATQTVVSRHRQAHVIPQTIQSIALHKLVVTCKLVCYTTC